MNSPSTISPDAAFGYYIEGYNSKKNDIGRNIYKVLDYTPIIGIITGIFYVKILLEKDTAKSNNDVYWALRAVTQIVGLGFLLVIPDIIATLYTGHQYKKQHFQTQQ